MHLSSHYKWQFILTLLLQVWMNLGDHQMAAQLLLRVGENISRFPCRKLHWSLRLFMTTDLHNCLSFSWCIYSLVTLTCISSDLVAILTSLVIECTKASYKKHAIQYAVQLMRDEYRSLIDPRFKRKIETLVRKSASTSSNRQNDTNASLEQDEMLSLTSPCPFCSTQVVNREMTCVSCKNQIPFCIASGYHITRENVTFCPGCNFPALLSYFEKMSHISPSSHSSHTNISNHTDHGHLDITTSTTLACPMCSLSLSSSQLTLASPDKLDAFLAFSKST